jgi:excisionase family DNA binding protein
VTAGGHDAVQLRSEASCIGTRTWMEGDQPRHAAARAHSVRSWRFRLLARLLTVDQAASALNTTPRFVRRLIAERRIAFHHVGRHVRIAEDDLLRFVQAGRVDEGGTA